MFCMRDLITSNGIAVRFAKKEATKADTPIVFMLEGSHSILDATRGLSSEDIPKRHALRTEARSTVGGAPSP